MAVLVDPPSGWMYGFPAVLQDDYIQQLKDARYPEKDIPLALNHSRFIGDSKEEIQQAMKLALNDSKD